MAQITEKELSGLSDLLSAEQLIIAKYQDYACHATDSAIKNQYEQLVTRHQRHYDELYSNLK